MMGLYSPPIPQVLSPVTKYLLENSKSTLVWKHFIKQPPTSFEDFERSKSKSSCRCITQRDSSTDRERFHCDWELVHAESKLEYLASVRFGPSSFNTRGQLRITFRTVWLSRNIPRNSRFVPSLNRYFNGCRTVVERFQCRYCWNKRSSIKE